MAELVVRSLNRETAATGDRRRGLIQAADKQISVDVGLGGGLGLLRNLAHPAIWWTSSLPSATEIHRLSAR